MILTFSRTSVIAAQAVACVAVEHGIRELPREAGEDVYDARPEVRVDAEEWRAIEEGTRAVGRRHGFTPQEQEQAVTLVRQMLIG